MRLAQIGKFPVGRGENNGGFRTVESISHKEKLQCRSDGPFAISSN